MQTIKKRNYDNVKRTLGNIAFAIGLITLCAIMLWIGSFFGYKG